MRAFRLASPLQYATAMACGSLFALLIWAVLLLQTKYMLAALAGMVLLGATLFFFDHLADFLLYLLVVNIPLVGFEKSLFFRTEAIAATNGFGIGLADLLLFALYLHWAFRILVDRSEPFPRLQKMDYWVFGFLAVNVLSIVGSASVPYTLFEVFRMGKYAFLYLYISRNLRRAHLRPLLLLLFLIVLTQTALGLYQGLTGSLLGLGATKGSVEQNTLDFLAMIPGFGRPQASGTLMTPHCLGVFLTMLLMIALAVLMEEELEPPLRWLAAAIFVIGTAGVVATFARGAWVAFAVAVFMVFLFYLRRQPKAIVAGALLAVVLVPIVLFNWSSIHKRIFDAPPEIMQERWELMKLGFRLFRQHPMLGVGANAFYQAHDEYDPRDLLNTYKKPPVHNLALFVAAQTGALGFTFFFAVIVAALRRSWRVAQRSQGLLRAMAFGTFAALIAEQIEGITNFSFYTNVLYFWLWFSIAMVVALERFSREPAAAAGQLVTAA